MKLDNLSVRLAMVVRIAVGFLLAGCNCNENPKSDQIVDDCDAGDAQECETALGVGVEYCTNGFWSNCTVGDCLKAGQTRLCDDQRGTCKGNQQTCGEDNKWESCSQPPNEVDVCDGKDDNCDGVPDEDCTCESDASRECETDTGPGIVTCEEGVWSECKPGACLRDGTQRPCDNQLGACEGSTQTCAGGQWGACTKTPAEADLCAGEDDDCSGVADDTCSCQTDAERECETSAGPGVARCIDGFWSTCRAGECLEDNEQRLCDNQLGECKGATQTCEGGQWSACSTLPQGVDACDGKDENCDGIADEDCSCQAGAQRECETEIGPGVAHCIDGYWTNCRVGECLEDGLEQLCNNQLGECQGATQICEAGRWSDCSRSPEAADSCDGEDENCDGSVDEGCSCEAGVERECETELGPGVSHCVDGFWTNCRVGECLEQGLEQLCDNQLGECQGATQVCDAGEWSACSIAPQADDACDGRDENCDGNVDEGCSCETGAQRECEAEIGPGVAYCVDGFWSGCRVGECLEEGLERLCDNQQGECRGGRQACVSGHWGPCSLTPATVDACDGKDNDCDASVDEACSCQNGAQRECEAEIGPGVAECIDGFWSNCRVGECLEEGLTRFCDNQQGVCAGSTQSCVGGNWAACSMTPTALDACDGEDNNCNGSVDEGCTCPTGTQRPCGLDAGLCETGMQTCDAGNWGPCAGAVDAAPEICDGEDNDCDGKTDNGFGVLGALCTAEGSCPGTSVCSADKRSTYCVMDETRFGAETCDDIDNDCDGLVDRVVEGGSIVSVCECRPRRLVIGDSQDQSIDGNVNLCEETRCAGDFIPRRSIDGKCWPNCESAASDPEGDGWGYENGATCLVIDSPRAIGAPFCAEDGVPLGMSIKYCMTCTNPNLLPYAMCESLPRFNLTAFARGELWMRVEYAYEGAQPARTPVNLWFHGGGGRKRLPLVALGDPPGPYEKLLRVDEACFEASEAFGSSCPGKGEACSHCGATEVCGAISDCGDYDLSLGWLQLAAEFCPEQLDDVVGAVRVTNVELVEPTCLE